MLMKKIKYTDYNDVERNETFYFNLSKPELIELQASPEGGLSEYINKIAEEQDMKKIIEFFKTIINLSYGCKSADGKRFVKSKELTEAFMQSEAYSELFMELSSTNEIFLTDIELFVSFTVIKSIALIPHIS